jgi:hypothetical protein
MFGFFSFFATHRFFLATFPFFLAVRRHLSASLSRRHGGRPLYRRLNLGARAGALRLLTGGRAALVAGALARAVRGRDRFARGEPVRVAFFGSCRRRRLLGARRDRSARGSTRSRMRPRCRTTGPTGAVVARLRRRWRRGGLRGRGRGCRGRLAGR